MIVMKFGGSSLASSDSLKKVVEIVRGHRLQNPVIVASAMGDTTDFLLEAVTHARNGRTAAAIEWQDTIKSQHYSACEALLHNEQRELVERCFQKSFRDLHVRILELAEGEREFTPELQDSIVSLGEQWSSLLLASVLDEHCSSTTYLDSRKLVLTDDNFTDAEPLYWETYARIRWTVPHASREKLVVLGGFIGSTADGRTTTLGRGGSDLTASMVGAAVNAAEVQVWKDVNGMLTCDPRVVPGGYQVTRLTYREATELAEAGATILHPKTMEPAKRLRIPIVVRNTFQPANPGTRIVGTVACEKSVVKSIAIRQSITLLEAAPTESGANCKALIGLCDVHNSGATVLSTAGSNVYIALDETAVLPESELGKSSCIRVRLRADQAVITLVGDFLDTNLVFSKAKTVLGPIPAFLIPSDEPNCAVRLSVPQKKAKHCAALLHKAFFANPDAKLFTAPRAAAAVIIKNAKTQPAQRNTADSFAGSISLVHQS